MKNGPNGSQYKYVDAIKDMKVEELMAVKIDGSLAKDGGGISGSLIKRLRIQYSDDTPADAPPTFVLKWADFQQIDHPCGARYLLSSNNMHLADGFRIEDKFFNVL